jgi:asparagine synthase (glutamine-hydrolysing)
MCGIAGIVDLSGQNRPIPAGVLSRMAAAIVHRGPDEDGFFERPGIGLANRRLSIVGLADGKQPIKNESGSVAVVFNGEFFDYVERRAELEARGHHFRTHTDTEIIPHLWEDYQEDMFAHLHGQFALACWDEQRRRLILGRDQFGICPLFWSRQSSDQGDWLLFGSEIKALLASGMVVAKPDLRGIDQVFNFLAVPGPATCFEGVQILQPGYYLRIDLPTGQAASTAIKQYWSIDFPAMGHERDGDAAELVAEFEETMLAAVERRLRADVPVVSYLSGGIDSSLVVAMACKIRGTPIPTFTIQILDPKLDETKQAAMVSRHIGAKPVVVPVGNADVTHTYAELTRAAEAPVIDTSCTALLMLARTVHQHGYKVALTGEGSDEWLAGYSWYKFHRLLSVFDRVPGWPISAKLRRVASWAMGSPRASADYLLKVRTALGHHSAFQDFYGMMSQSRERFFSPATKAALFDHIPYLAMEPPLDKMKTWDPMNQGLYWAGRIHLPGHLLSLKGDRVAMNSSVEARYPFLDESVFKFLADLHPHWKMRGMKEKYILRLLGERYLPYEVAWRKKGMFRAPLDSFFGPGMPGFINQLLSPESLAKTGYFDAAAVAKWLPKVRDNQLSILQRASVELGLVGVTATQLWHHVFIDGSLADIPSGWQRPKPLLAAG